MTPISQPGHEGSWIIGITSPIANRLKNAPSKAVFLSGNDIGSIKPTSIAPKIRPLTRPDKRGDMARRIKNPSPFRSRGFKLGHYPKSMER